MEINKSDSDWKQKIKNFINEYGIEAKEDEIDNTYEEAKSKGRRYRYPGKRINYLSFNYHGFNYISLVRSFDWTNKGRHQSWVKCKVSNSYDDSQVFRTWLVFWVDINFSFFHVKKNNYELFVNQCFHVDWCRESLEIRVLINDKEIIKKTDYPKVTDTLMNYSEYLREDLLCIISKDDFEGLTPDEHGDFTVKVLYSNNSTKIPIHRWSLDGGRLHLIEKLPENFVPQHIIKEEKNFSGCKKKVFTSVNRDPISDSVFAGRLKKNLSVNLLEFFNFSDLVELAKVNIFLRNTISFYEEQYDYWPIKFAWLCNNFGINEEIKNFDNSLEEAMDRGRKYKCCNINRDYYGDNSDNYLVFDSEGISHICKLKGGDCYQNYRFFRKYPGTYDPDFGMVYYIKGTCWVNREIDFFHIQPGFYEFFVHHAFDHYFRREGLRFYFIIYGKNKLKYVYETLFPSDETVDGRKEELYEEPLCVINKSDFDDIAENDDGGYLLRAYFVNDDASCNAWKEGWILDGGRLLEIDEETYENEVNNINH